MKRTLLVSGGLLCVGLAFLGVALPGLPTVPLLLLATACFARSSPRLHDWLLNNRTFGPMLRSWRENRVIPLRAKVLGIAMLVAVGCISAIRVEHAWIRIIIGLVLLVPLGILLRAKSSAQDANSA